MSDVPRGETFSLGCGSERFLEERLVCAEGLVGLTVFSRGDWHSRRRDSQQKDKMQISMGGGVRGQVQGCSGDKELGEQGV